MTTTAEATAPPARLTQRQMTLRLARLIRKGLPGPVAFRCRSIFAARLAAAPCEDRDAITRPVVHIYLADSADLAKWAADLDLRIECTVHTVDTTSVRHEYATGVYEGWTVGLSVLTSAHLAAPFRPRQPMARRLSRLDAGRLV